MKFYNKEYAVYQDMLRNRQINGAENVDVDRYLQARIAAFTKASQEVEKRLPAPNSAPFVITFSNYEEIFNPIKKLYWDEVAERYIGLILSQFHKQCDSVLNGAKMFEKFIKTLSIADFMNNMEGAINE